MTRGETGHADGTEPGGAVIRVGIVATAVFTVVQVLAAIVAVKAVLAVAVGVALALFLLGVVVYVAAFLQAVGRSRTEEIDLAGLFLLADAPRPVRRALATAWLVQVLVALATAAARPFSSLAFGILVPLFGGALACLWSARYGVFPERGQSRSSLRTVSSEAKAGPGTTDEPDAGRPRRRWFDPVDLDDDAQD